jgi:type I restriction enzyme S subunit
MTSVDDRSSGKLEAQSGSVGGRYKRMGKIQEGSRGKRKGKRMKSKWRKVRLGDVVHFNPKEALPKGIYAKKISMEHLLPHTRQVSGYEISPFSGGSKFRNGDTLMARITPCLENGKTAQVNLLHGNEIGFGSTEFIVLRGIRDKSDNDFIYYLAISQKLRDIAVKSMVGSSGRQRVQQNILENLNISLPPLHTQRAIASTLSCFDGKIALNHRINANLEAQAQGIFKSWFVDFEPWGGVMPKDWRKVEFSSFLTPKIEKSNDPTIPLFSVTDTGIYPRGEKFTKNLSKIDTKNKIVRKTDIVFGMSRKILNWGIMRSPIGAVSSAYNVFGVDCSINLKYLESFIKVHSLYFKGLIRPSAREGQGIDKEVLILKSIYLPQDDILAEYYRIEDLLTTSIHKKNEETARLAAIRDALLPKLMSGEIEVEE